MREQWQSNKNGSEIIWENCSLWPLAVTRILQQIKIVCFTNIYIYIYIYFIRSIIIHNIPAKAEEINLMKLHWSGEMLAAGGWGILLKPFVCREERRQLLSKTIGWTDSQSQDLAAGEAKPSRTCCETHHFDSSCAGSKAKKPPCWFSLSLNHEKKKIPT